MIKKLIPDYVYKTIYDMPLKELYDSGIRLILTDLDNTLISYAEKLPNEKLLKWKDEVINTGFEFILVSNSRKVRVDNFCKEFNIPYQKFSTKPLKRGIKRAIKKVAKGDYKNDEVLLIGDQLMTDILGAKRCKIKAGLIFPVDKSTDVRSTRGNRRLERFFLKRIKKKMPDVFNEKLKEFSEA